VIPLRDDNPAVLTPVATIAVIALNGLAWTFFQGLGSPRMLAQSVCTLGLIPGELLGTLPAGATIDLGDVVCQIGGSSWYTVLSSMFMHGSWMHLLGNMWFLWIFGNNVEDAMGCARFLVFYLICGLAAAAVQVLSDPRSAVPMVGASGAIGGVMGAYIVLYPRVHVHMLVILGFYVTSIAVPAVFMLAYWFLVQLLGGLLGGTTGGGTAFWAHVGGFLAGITLIYGFRDPRLLRPRPYDEGDEPRTHRRS